MNPMLVNFLKIFFKRIDNNYVDIVLCFIPSRILNFTEVKESNVAIIIMSLLIYVF